MSITGRVLVIDDDADLCAALADALTSFGFEVKQTTSSSEGFALAMDEDLSAIVTDLSMDGLSGVEMCERLAALRPDVPVIVLTGSRSMETAIAAMRAGAFDFLAKPVEPSLLRLSVERAIKHRKLHTEVLRLREVLVERKPIDSLIGTSAAMKRLRDMVSRVAASDASVLICGETGTGKELVAHAIHAASGRSAGRFVAINCAAVPAQLLESELFGHAKGAFTDARITRQGLFVKASGGTLFLDEIGDMPLEMQSKLLRALQERVVRPVGSDTETPFDARIVAATHRNLEADVAAGRFRQDLYYRIHVVRIDVPALRDRGDDVLALAAHFTDQICKRTGRPRVNISASVAQRLLSYDWPGNVRELENCIEHAEALARFSEISTEDIPERIRSHRPEALVESVGHADAVLTLDELERRYIMRVLRLVNGNKSRAAELLGLDRRTLYRRLDQYAKSSERATAVSIPSPSLELVPRNQPVSSSPEPAE
jgi:DNA-binding NtrC family response regulator